MLDRIPNPGQEGRVLITPENGEPFYAKIEMADNPIQNGMPLNKANLLTDETAMLLGLIHGDPTVNDAFKQLSEAPAGMGTLYIYCIDENENPVSGCVVQVLSNTAVTNSFGMAKFSLSPGTYSASVRSPIDYGADSQSISANVSLGKASIVDIIIQDTTHGDTELDITSSVKLSFSGRVTNADVFAVGGGGSGGAIACSKNNNGQGAVACGGAGGKTETAFSIDTTSLLSITIGAGGASKSVTFGGVGTGTSGSAGGTTSVLSSDGNVIVSAEGGSGGGTTEGNVLSDTFSVAGASGGSGSGAAEVGDRSSIAGASGSDGASGSNTKKESGGSGQGTTTRAFGEPDGELFASAGGSVATQYQTNEYTQIGSVGEGGGIGDGKSGSKYSAVGSPGSTPGSGGGGAATFATSSNAISSKSGAGANGLVRFRWEVSV